MSPFSLVSRCRCFLAVWLVAVASAGAVATAAAPVATFATDGAVFGIDAKGSLASVARKGTGRDLLAPGQPTPLLSVRVAQKLHAPDQASWDAASGKLSLRFTAADVTAVVRAEAKGSHVVFELVEVRPLDRVDLVLWGPYPLVLGKTVGEVVGVVRDGDSAFGLQALNTKTLGGFPDNDEGSADQPYAARRTAWGSVLQAYSMDRSKPRSIAVWGKRAPDMPVGPIPGETVLGSRIALFGGAEADALATIGKIEVAEKLPHPLIDGVWAKVSPQRGRSYLIADFSEADVDEMLGYVKRADLMSLYHGNAFKSWGHFEPSPKFFPGGVAGLKACADKAKALGIRLGAHTLSDFIQPTDPYVTPVPDPRLVRTGSSPLTEAVDAAATEIGVESPRYFAQQDRNEMHTVMIGQELVRYRAVSTEAPWKLLDCTRGAFGTVAAAHVKGEAAGKLMDHSYRVFFPDMDLLREIARNLARRFNETGLTHMDFDGHEGCLAPGQGTYGNEVFAKEFHDHLDATVINGTSPPLSHYYWHFNSYCNWGEPWYGGFRDSMQEYRINNQAFCERNYIPKMLGWYLLTPTTCVSDMEWTLARAAGFDAGFALATSPTALRKNAATGRILDAIREWESARRGGAFTAAQRERLRDPKREFHLERVAEGEWDLFPLRDSAELVHEPRTLQPGEPTAAQWEFDNPDGLQGLQFKLRAIGTSGSIVDPVLEIGQAASLTIPVEVQAGQSVLVEGDGVARIYDAKGSQIRSVPLTGVVPKVQPGKNAVRFDCAFNGPTPPKVVVTVKTVSAPTRVQRTK